MPRFGPIPLIFTFFWLFFLIVGQSKLLRDPGTLWHTKVGEKVLTEGFFEGDPYTFTFGGRSWVPHQWLGEVVMALAYRFGGFDAFVLLASVILAVLLTVMTTRLLKTGLNFAVVALIAGCALAAVSTHLHVRPLLMTTISLAVTAMLLTDFDDDRIGLKRLFWLVPLFIAWTNMHGGMLGGLASLGLVVAGWIFWRLLEWPSPLGCRRTAFWLVTITLFCTLAMFVNPYGTETPKAWFSIIRAPKIPQLIEEHQPLDPSKPTAWALFLFAAIYLVVLAGLNSKPRVTWLLPLFWLVQSFFRVRHAPLFAVTAMVAITSMWPMTRWAVWLAGRRPDIYDPQKTVVISRTGWIIPGILVSISLLFLASKTNFPVIGAGWARLDEERWPTAIVAEIQSRQTDNPHIFNDCEYGGFLIFFAPGYRTFIDDRAELYGEDFLDEFVQGGTSNASEAIRKWAERYGGFQYALVRPGTQFDDHFKKGWTLIAACEAGNFYGR